MNNGWENLEKMLWGLGVSGLTFLDIGERTRFTKLYKISETPKKQKVSL